MTQIKRLIVCCDGTWNDSVSTNNPLTNVARFSRCIEERTQDGILQIVYYHTGVGAGTSKISNSIDGAVGRGLGANVRNAYNFICQNFNHKDCNDEIILVGFSRGAFTVRCVASLIDSVGILTKRGLSRLYEVYGLWKKQGEDGAALKTLVDDLKRDGLLTTGVKIKACGVWDTVSAIGVQLPAWLPQPPTKKLTHVDNRIPTCIENAFHAMALDERRSAFWPLPWSEPHHNITFRQCWFLGAHSDVGGGNEDAGLAKVALIWMIAQFQHFTSVAFDEAYLLDILSGTGEVEIERKEHVVAWSGYESRTVQESRRSKSEAGNISNSLKWFWQPLGKRPRKPGRPFVINKVQHSIGVTGAKDDLGITRSSVPPTVLSSGAIIGSDEVDTTAMTTASTPKAHPLRETNDTIHPTVRILLAKHHHSCPVLEKYQTTYGSEQADGHRSVHWHRSDNKRRSKDKTSAEDAGPDTSMQEAEVTPEEKKLFELWLSHPVVNSVTRSHVVTNAFGFPMLGSALGGSTRLEQTEESIEGYGSNLCVVLGPHVDELVNPTLMYNSNETEEES
ncbi:hypothetical protein DE146DRAFT_764489 [Phaeosphaeria sp. MPI-PUGE-AT-0046c]|nr:hypothetical protein DE146DRAFT_764489 [Phaeosphaeria sp. MPI-PUGE-AT-0046c]